MRHRFGMSTLLAAVGLTAALALPAAAAPAPTLDTGHGGAPTSFPLPDGFQPEGIAIGPGPYAFFGSRADGSIYRTDLRTGRGAVFSAGPGTPSLGLKTDAWGRLFVAGGTGGDARIIDTRTGRVLASYQFVTGNAFVNDVVLTRHAAYFTDSRNPTLYALPLHPDGRLPAADEVVRTPLTGDLVYGEGNNANGIAATPDGRALLVVQSNTGGLFRVDPRTGATAEVDLGGETLTNGDGLLLRGTTLYAVQNRLNTIAVLRVRADGATARLVDRLTDERFDIPTTVAAFGDRLYLPNARFTTPPTPTTPYNVVAIRRG